LLTGISTLGAYFFALPPFSGASSLFHKPPLLPVCYDSLPFVFQFWETVWLLVLLTGSEDELCDLLPALLWGVAYHFPTVHFPANPVFVY
jgi:hypothetical protein